MSNLLHIKRPKPKENLYAKLLCPSCRNEYLLALDKLEALRSRQRRHGPQKIKCLKCEAVHPVRVEADRVIFYKPDAAIEEKD